MDTTMEFDFLVEKMDDLVITQDKRRVFKRTKDGKLIWTLLLVGNQPVQVTLRTLDLEGD